jgi:hypothetical protein
MFAIAALLLLATTAAKAQWMQHPAGWKPCPRGFDACFNRCLSLGGAGAHSPAVACSGRCSRVCSMAGANQPAARGRYQPYQHEND